eukprot:gene25451-28768_t
MNQHHTTDARSSTRDINEGNFDVIALKNEIDSLNNLLAESAMALNNLNDKLQQERMQKSKLLAELDGRNEDVHDLMTENQHLRAEMQELRLKMKTHGNHGDDKTIEEPVLEPADNFLASTLRATHAEVTALLKTHAEVMCDVMVEAETDLMQLLARFPGVDFEKKEVEIGWVGRNSRSQSALDPDSPSGISAHSAGTESSSAGYFFGSPSERFPIAEQSALSELDEEDSENDNDSSHSEDS